MTTLPSDAIIGRLIDGRYEVLHRVARGGMATVYRAVDRRLDREVAVKVMHAHLAESEDFITRFRREARAAARLSHPNVVAVYDQGLWEDSFYLTMEFVEGEDLRALLRREGPLPLGRALEITRAVLDALAAAHRRGQPAPREATPRTAAKYPHLFIYFAGTQRRQTAGLSAEPRQRRLAVSPVRPAGK